MRISILKKRSKSIGKFSKEEWPFADVIHYGRPDVNWNPKTFWVKATRGRETIGCLRLSTEGGIGEIPGLIVSHKHQRQGVGKALIDKAAEITKKEGGHKLYLLTGKDWEALKFYKALGFVECGELKDFYLHVDFVFLVKKI